MTKKKLELEVDLPVTCCSGFSTGSLLGVDVIILN